MFGFWYLVDRGRMYTIEFTDEPPTSSSIDWTTDRPTSDHAIDATSTRDSIGWTSWTGDQWAGATSQWSSPIDRWRYITVLFESLVEFNRWESSRVRTIYTFDGLTSLSTHPESVRLGHDCADENSRIVEQHFRSISSTHLSLFDWHYSVDAAVLKR